MIKSYRGYNSMIIIVIDFFELHGVLCSIYYFHIEFNIKLQDIKETREWKINL